MYIYIYIIHVCNVYLISCYIISFQKQLFKCVVFVFVGVKSEQGPYDDVEISESS